MQPKELQLQTRRHFFQQSGFGIGSLALCSLLKQDLFEAPSDLFPFALRRLIQMIRVRVEALMEKANTK